MVFCFTRPEDAEAFCQRFGGERLLKTWRSMSLSAEQRQVLEILAGSPPRGYTKGRLLAGGFTVDTPADLVREGSPRRNAGA